MVSGFLTAYNHHGEYAGTLDECVAIVRKKLRSIYPVYLAGILLATAYMLVSKDTQGLTRFGLAATALVDLTLMQAWIPGIAFKYDGAAWFLSAILVCYALSPFVSRLVEWAKERLKSDVLGAIAVGMGSFAVLLFLEICQRKMPELYSYRVHIAPPLCLLRFVMGYAAGSLYPRLSEALDGRRRFIALAEVLFVGFVLWVVVAGNAVLPRSVFTLLATGVVLLLSLGFGPVSKLLGSAPLVRMGKYELAFYVFHQPCIFLAAFLIGGMGRKALLAFVLTCFFVFLWETLGKRCVGWISRRGQAGGAFA